MAERLIPGRSCPLHYRYAAHAFTRPAELAADTLYVIGGLYGNPYALRTILAMVADEPGEPKLVFNGDFNWFDVDAGDFAAVNHGVLEHVALRGNVETELGEDDDATGCGCGYPDWVGDAEVERSNHIMRLLKDTARGEPELRARLAALPMHLVAEVGGARIGIVHGDADSLAGWNFSQQNLGARPQQLAGDFDAAAVDIFASSHTCLPVALHCGAARGAGLVINNGAAGMPNFTGTHFGLITRISTRPASSALYGMSIAGVHVQALPVHYDQAAWVSRFDAIWPQDSPASVSYRRRITLGPAYCVSQANRLDSGPGGIEDKKTARATAA